MNRLRSLYQTVAALLVGSALLIPVPAPLSEPGADGGPCDFDGDGDAELVIGVPGRDSGAPDAGAVVVIGGQADGVDAGSGRWWNQDSPGLRGRGERGDGFGASHHCGDFDGDGYGDLAIGVPRESVAGAKRAGAVAVLFGSANGLTPRRDQLLSLETAGVPGTPRQGDQLGAALAVADFDGDGRDDLAVGAPGRGSGVVYVIPGGSSGLAAAESLRLRQGVAGMRGNGEVTSRFGAALAAGDLDGDGSWDLVVGVPGEKVKRIDGAGAIHLVFGDGSGLGVGDNRVVHQAKSGIEGVPWPRASFGHSLAVADLDGDGRDDVAGGAPGYGRAGRVSILYGSSDRSESRDHLLRPSATNRNAGFGWSLVSADFDASGTADLIVGSPAARQPGSRFAGLADVWMDPGEDPGEASRPLSAAEPSFGAALGSSAIAGDFDGDGHDDVAVAARGTRVEGHYGAGAIHVGYGGPSGVEQFDEVLTARSGGIRGAPRGADRIGALSGSWDPVLTRVARLRVVPRSAWEARSPVVSRLSPHEIDRLTIHHAGTLAGTTGPPQFRGWQNWHMDGRGWGDIAYHYLIGEDGKVYTGRDPAYEGDTGTNYDTTGHLQIVTEGMFDEEHPTSQELRSLAIVVAWGVSTYDIPLKAIAGHRDRAATSCPGEHLYPHIAEGDLVDEVSEILDSGGVFVVR